MGLSVAGIVINKRKQPFILCASTEVFYEHFILKKHLGDRISSFVLVKETAFEFTAYIYYTCILDRFFMVGKGIQGANGRIEAVRWEERVSNWSVRVGRKKLSR